MESHVIRRYLTFVEISPHLFMALLFRVEGSLVAKRVGPFAAAAMTRGSKFEGCPW